jgi:hypothetical protein
MAQPGPGLIRHLWMTLQPAFYRDVVIRVFWNGRSEPAIECPIGDFFCLAWGAPAPVLAIPINVNARGGLNAYLPMPFTEHARIDVTNENEKPVEWFFYAIDFSLEDLPADTLHLHAQFRRTPRLASGSAYTILDGVAGTGHLVGVFLAWEQRCHGWWGEGEVKMYLDDDDAFPTICGTGTEDYFGGAWCFGENYSAPYLGYRLVSGRERTPGARMAMYRFHVPDPVYFNRRIRVTVQALGWAEEPPYVQLEDDISSVAWWYQTLPAAAFPVFPDRDARAFDASPAPGAS